MSGLSNEVGMKTSPTMVLDLFLGHISMRYQLYHILPGKQLPGLDMVMQVLTHTASAYTKSSEKIPVLFIDGVDLLAKRNTDLCSALISLAKILANSKKIKIVLVQTRR